MLAKHTTKPMITLQRQLAIFSDLMPGKQYLHHLQIFLFVAEARNCTYKDIEDFFHLSNASASRSLTAMGVDPNHRKEGMGLVECYPDPAEGRRLRVRLSKKGLLIFDQMIDA